MYAIRVGAEGEVLEAVFSGSVPPGEVLRAVSQAFVLAEAVGIRRAICDTRDIETGLTRTNLSLLAAGFSGRVSVGQRVAVLCTPEQLRFTRRFARLARIGEEFGVFTRPTDAEEWLARVPQRHPSETMLRHMKALVGDRKAEQEPASRESRIA